MRRTDAIAWIMSLRANVLRRSQAKTSSQLVSAAVGMTRASLAEYGPSSPVRNPGHRQCEARLSWQTQGNLNLEGYFEEILAERIALLLWRLGRIARYEREAAASAFENTENGLARDLLRSTAAGPRGVANAKAAIATDTERGKPQLLAICIRPAARWLRLAAPNDATHLR